MQNLCFMTNRMVNLANLYNDVLFIDTTHKNNRFNLPLLDIVAVNNLGKTVTVFISLLENQKTESFVWALKSFASKLTNKPLLIFSDEDDAIISRAR